MTELPKIEGGWRTILADVPWPYNQKLTAEKTRGGAEKHYETMTIEEIMSLRVGDIAAKDCQLWFWCTNNHIHNALHIVEKWGFEYKTMATWIKRHFGLGYWLRCQSEHLILATKGKPRTKFIGPNGATGLNYSTVIIEPTHTYSVKPEASYRMIEAMGEEPRLELFARKRREGWTQWGLELESELQTRIDLVK